MTHPRTRRVLRPLGAMVTLLLAACGSDNGSPPPPATPTLTAVRTATATPTRAVTATPTRTSGAVPHPSPSGTRTPTTIPTFTPIQSGAVSGLVVVNRTVMSGPGDVLGAPPPEWSSSPGNAPFDRSLGNADWSVPEADKQGVTGPDGRFALSGLAPGHYNFQVTKTLDGNLAAVSFPFSVGDDGGADVVAEVSLGLVRSVSTFTRAGAQVQEVRGPYGNWLTTQDGHVREVGDPSRSFVDTDGDGQFVATPCFANVTSCRADSECGADRACRCTEGCPSCPNVCNPGVCVPFGATPPYSCDPSSNCPGPGDRCVCVPSCPACDDCVRSLCVPGCTPVQMTAITITGAPSELVVGQQGGAFASALFSDGGRLDVTYLATWHSSNDAVVTVDSWGTVVAHGIGQATLTATIGTLSSAPWSVEVVARPSLQRIDLQNISCIYPLGVPTDFGSKPPVAAPPDSGILQPRPSCGPVVQIGKTVQFRALGQFANGYYQDITDEVQWQATPAAVGTVVGGLFTAQQAGTTTLTASLDGVVSDGTSISVVTEPTLTALSIYADSGIIAFVDGGPQRVDVAVPCPIASPSGLCCCPGPLVDAAPNPCDCGYTITVLRGDQLKFRATAQYDTGEFRDVTAEVTWRSSNAAAATIDLQGVMTAIEAGDATIDATLGTVSSNTVGAHVVNQATLQFLYIYQDGTDRVVAKGDQRFFKATGNYDIGFGRDVTSSATWRSSDDAIGGFDTPGVFTARAAGTVQVWAELDGTESARVSLEVYETSDITYCDPAHVNRAVWSDNFNLVTLESDCGQYHQPGVAALRYTVVELQPHGGIFDPCLDLYVYQGDQRIRTIREEGCGAPFLPGNAPEHDAAVLKYQLRAFWDLKGDDGQPVSPGSYTIYGRFYLYYDPVVRIDVNVGSGDGHLPDLVPSGVHSGRCSLETCVPQQMSSVCVRNQGDAPSGAFLVAVDNRSVPFSALGAGVEECVDVPELTGATIVADVSNRVVESREDNNRGTFTGPMPAPTACDFVPPDCTPSIPTTPTPTPRALCTPVYCPTGVLVCPNNNCPGGCGYVCVPPEQLASLDIGSATGARGDAVQFDVSLHTGSQPVSGTQNDVLFDPSVPVAAQANGRPNCAVNPDIGKNGTAFAFIPAGCHSGVDCTGIRAIVIATDNNDLIPDAAVLYTCKVVIASTVPPGIYPLAASGVAASDPTGARILITSNSGSLTVVPRPGEVIPTVSATPTPPSYPICTPPQCGPGEVRSCSNGCIGGCGFICATPTPTPAIFVCTPPPCTDGQVPLCPGSCPGGCGSVCGQPSPTPTPEGFCYHGSPTCQQGGEWTSHSTCCMLSRLSASPLTFSWCSTTDHDPDTGSCALCASDPCLDVPIPTGSATPTPASVPVCTPPPCADGEVPLCPGSCPGGCGSVCGPLPPTPTPAVMSRVVPAKHRA